MSARSKCLVDSGRKPAPEPIGVQCEEYVLCQGVSVSGAWRSEPIKGDARKAGQDVAALRASTSEHVWAETIKGEFVAGEKPEVQS